MVLRILAPSALSIFGIEWQDSIRLHFLHNNHVLPLHVHTLNLITEPGNQTGVSDSRKESVEMARTAATVTKGRNARSAIPVSHKKTNPWRELHDAIVGGLAGTEDLERMLDTLYEDGDADAPDNDFLADRDGPFPCFKALMATLVDKPGADFGAERVRACVQACRMVNGMSMREVQDLSAPLRVVGLSDTLLDSTFSTNYVHGWVALLWKSVKAGSQGEVRMAVVLEDSFGRSRRTSPCT